jgi:competence protein ComGF
MIKYLRRSLIVFLLVVMLFTTLACNKENNRDVTNADKTDFAEDINNTKSTEVNDLNETENETENDTKAGNELAYNKSKSLVENANILNEKLQERYGKSLTLSSVEDYEKADQTDWILVFEDNRVGIDTSTWKFEYDSNSDDSKYMDAILATFTFFCGEEMGYSLWSLTGDLLDGGADETLYGFVHNGSQAIYKNGNIAAYESGENKSIMYIWLTPSEY